MSLIITPDTVPALEFKFYNGEETLRFDKIKWQFTRLMPDGSWSPVYGVTKVLHTVLDKSQPLMAWAVKLALNRLKQLLSERGYFGENASPLFEETFDELVAKAKKADKDALEEAGTIGSTAHDWIEQYIKTILSDNEDRRLELLAHLPLDERAANACIAACEWMSKHNVRWIRTERKCFSRKYGYAGTMDGLAIVSSCSNPVCCPHHFVDRLTLIDWKTSNALYVEYVLQTASYQQAYQEETGEIIEDRWVIRLGKDDAEFDPWHIEGPELFEQDIAGFTNALALFKSVHDIDDRLDKIKDARAELKWIMKQAEKDAANKIACPASKEYKGTRKKKGCNATEQMCQACIKIWEDKHDGI